MEARCKRTRSFSWCFVSGFYFLRIPQSQHNQDKLSSCADKEPTSSLAQGCSLPARAGVVGEPGDKHCMEKLGGLCLWPISFFLSKSRSAGRTDRFLQNNRIEHAAFRQETTWSPRWQTSMPMETSGELTELSFEPDVVHHVDTVSTTFLQFHSQLFTWFSQETPYQSWLPVWSARG